MIPALLLLALGLSARRLCQAVVIEWHQSDDRLDIWSFRKAERLRVHEARTLADTSSCAVRGSVRVRRVAAA